MVYKPEKLPVTDEFITRLERTLNILANMRVRIGNTLRVTSASDTEYKAYRKQLKLSRRAVTSCYNVCSKYVDKLEITITEPSVRKTRDERIISNSETEIVIVNNLTDLWRLGIVETDLPHYGEIYLLWRYKGTLRTHLMYAHDEWLILKSNQPVFVTDDESEI